MSKKTQLLQWTKKYSLGDAAMDEEQKKMFDLFNEILAEIENTESEKNLPMMINGLNDQSKQFFQAEEKLLKFNECPDYELHAKGQRKFTRTVIELRRKIADTETPEDIGIENVLHLRQILIDHITTIHKIFSPFLRIQAYIRNQKNK